MCACAGPGHGRLEHAAALLDLQRHDLTRRVLGFEIMTESAPGIPPRLDRKAVPTDPVRHKSRFPTIVHHQVHRHAVPARLIRGSPQQLGGKHLMAISNDIGADRDLLAHNALQCKGTARDLRPNRFDADALGGHSHRLQVLVADKRSDNRFCRRASERPHLARRHRRVVTFRRTLHHERGTSLWRQRRQRQIDSRAVRQIRIEQHQHAARGETNVRCVRPQQRRDRVACCGQLPHLAVNLVLGHLLHQGVCDGNLVQNVA